MVYAASAGLKTRPFSVVRFGTNAVLRRWPSFDDLLRLGRGTHLIGAVIDGNSPTSWEEPFHFDISKRARAGTNDLAVRIAPAMSLDGPFRSISVVVK